jgi:hypothetical protein
VRLVFGPTPLRRLATTGSLVALAVIALLLLARPIWRNGQGMLISSQV